MLQRSVRSLASCVLIPAVCPMVLCQVISSLQPDVSQRVLNESDLRAKIKANPRDVDAARSFASLLERTGRSHAALTVRRAIATASVSTASASQAELELATSLVEEGQSSEAIPILQALVIKEPGNELAQSELGTAFARTEDFKSAAVAFAKAVQLQPSDAQAQLSAAKALVTLLRYSEAETYIDAAANGATQSAEIHVLRGVIYSRTSRNAEAVKEFEAASEEDQTNAETQLLLGESLLQERRFQDASVSLQRSATAHPTVAVYFQLAKAYHGLGDAEGVRVAIASLHAFQETQAIDTKIEVLRSAAEHAVAERHYDEAVKAYASAVELRPGNSDLLYHQALAEGQMGDREEELRLLREVLVRSPRMAGALSEVGILEGMKGDTVAAKKHLHEALSIDPQRADALSNLAVLVAQSGDLASAEALLTNAIESSPGYASAHRNLGLVYATEGRTADAEAALQKSVALDANDAANEVALGQFFLSQENAAGAVTAFRAAVALQPNDGRGRLLLARTLLGQGNVQGALEETHHAVGLSPVAPEAVELQSELCGRPGLSAASVAICREVGSRGRS